MKNNFVIMSVTLNMTLTFPCGPTTMTATELDWRVATDIYACGKYEDNTSLSNNAPNLRINNIIKYLLYTILFFNVVNGIDLLI